MKRFRFTYLVVLLLLIAMHCFILSPFNADCQPSTSCSCKIRASCFSITISCNRRRWSISEEGFTQKPQEAWIEWK